MKTIAIMNNKGGVGKTVTAINLADILVRDYHKRVVLADCDGQVKQTVYFYLYYSECLSLREIGELTGTHFSSITRTIRRAMRNIGNLLGGQDAILEHPEALDELAYQAYCELGDHPELVPEGIHIPHTALPPKQRGRKSKSHIPLPAEISIRVRGKRGKPPGKLLSALLERREARPGGSVFQWLTAVFAAFRRKLKKRAG